MCQFPYRGHGRTSYGLISNLSDILTCKKLIHLLRHITFKIVGVVYPSLDQIYLEIECLENKIGVELGENVKPKRN